MTPIYPDIEVQLTGQDGNAFAIIGRVSKALKNAKIPKPEIDKYVKEATSGDYDHLIQTTIKWVNAN